MADQTAYLAAFLGGQELWLILIIVLVLFGGAKLPSLARGLRQSIKEFKKASRDDAEEAKVEAKAAEAKKVQPADTHGSN